MKGWKFVYFAGSIQGVGGEETPVPPEDVEQAEKQYEEDKGAKVVSLQARRKLGRKMKLEFTGPMALVHILSAYPKYQGVRIDAVEDIPGTT